MSNRKKKARNQNSVVLSEKSGYTENMSIGLTNDVIFKYVFGAKESTHILTELINAVLTDSGFSPIVSITLKNPITPRAANWLKGTELDILGEDENGVQYDIEMQVSSEPNFVNRSLYYWAKQYSLQLVRGDLYTQLKPVICINLIDFVLVAEPKLFHTCYMLQDKQLPDAVLTQDLQIHFVELPKSKQFTGKLAAWAQLLRESDEYLEAQDMEVIIKQDRTMEEAYERYLESLRDKRAYFDALMREKWQRDQLSRQKAAEEAGLQAGMERGMERGLEQGMEQGLQKGMEQGLQKGMEQGLQEGMEQGLQEGMEQGLQKGMEQGLQKGMEQGLQQGVEKGLSQGLSQGARQKTLEIARALKLAGDSTEKIAGVTGLSAEEIEHA